MRIATLVVTLFLMLAVGLQSCTLYGLSAIAGQQETGGGAAVGLLIAFLYLLGAAFVMGLPLISIICFTVAGLLGLAVGATTKFSDMTIWGIVSFVLALMSFLGRRELRRRQRAAH
jgi:hypothetical protein